MATEWQLNGNIGNEQKMSMLPMLQIKFKSVTVLAT